MLTMYMLDVTTEQPAADKLVLKVSRHLNVTASCSAPSHPNGAIRHAPVDAVVS